MKNTNYLTDLKNFIKENNLVSNEDNSNKGNGINGLNEILNQSLFPEEIMPDIPNPKKINSLEDLDRYKKALSEWLLKFSGNSTLREEFSKGMELQRKLTFRAMELEDTKR